MDWNKAGSWSPEEPASSGAPLSAVSTKSVSRNILVCDQLGEDEKWRKSCATEIRRLHLGGEAHRICRSQSDGSGENPVGVSSWSLFGHHRVGCRVLMENNYRYTRILCDWALTRNARFVYASSAATYGDGANGMIDDEAKWNRFAPSTPTGIRNKSSIATQNSVDSCPKSLVLSFSTYSDRTNGIKVICEVLLINPMIRSSRPARFAFLKVTNQFSKTASRSGISCM